MDATERARLRALRETIPAGDVAPCCKRAGQDGHHSSWALGMMPHGAAIRAWVAGPLDLLALVRDALPALIEDSERLAKAERERDDARAGAVAAREHTDRAVDEIRRTLPAALRLAAEDERCACSEFAEKWLREVGEITQDTPADLAEAIRARGAGGAR